MSCTAGPGFCLHDNPAIWACGPGVPAPSGAARLLALAEPSAPLPRFQHFLPESGRSTPAGCVPATPAQPDPHLPRPRGAQRLFPSRRRRGLRLAHLGSCYPTLCCRGHTGGIRDDPRLFWAKPRPRELESLLCRDPQLGKRGAGSLLSGLTCREQGGPLKASPPGGTRRRQSTLAG